jgi:hypothetical protein
MKIGEFSTPFGPVIVDDAMPTNEIRLYFGPPPYLLGVGDLELRPADFAILNLAVPPRER